jgi:hypothetical protein
LGAHQHRPHDTVLWGAATPPRPDRQPPAGSFPAGGTRWTHGVLPPDADADATVVRSLVMGAASGRVDLFSVARLLYDAVDQARADRRAARAARPAQHGEHRRWFRRRPPGGPVPAATEDAGPEAG